MNDLIVAKVDKARQLLAECKDATKAKQIADMAHAAEVYAKRQKLSEEAITYAHAIKIDAMRLLGDFLSATPKNKGANGSVITGSKRVPVKDATPTLREAGIQKKESAQAQQIARIAAEGNGLYTEVRNGKKTVAQATRELQRDRRRQELHEKAKQADEVAREKKASGEQSWRLVHGDCVEVLKPLRLRPRLIFADPPYNQGVDYGDGERADRLSHDEYLLWCRRWIELCRGRLASDGSFWLLICDEYAAELGVMAKGAGFAIRSWIKWYETFGVNCANNFNRCSRHLFYCVPEHNAEASSIVFHAEAVNRPSDRQTKYGDSRADPGGKIWDNVWQIPRLVENAKERLPDFPTQLPLALLRPIIACATDPGDLVLDPFSGSATTGAAALELGREFFGIERQQRFVELASLRLKGIGCGTTKRAAAAQ